MSVEVIFKPRRYLHFDEPIPIGVARAIATVPETVAKWAFLPMLQCALKVRKVKRRHGTLERSTKTRPICFASHKDAAIYTYYGALLVHEYENSLKTNDLTRVVTAFRPNSGKCNIDFAKEAFDWIRTQTECVALGFDIKSFFDSLSHKQLKKRWATLLGAKVLPPDHYAVYRSITRYSFVSREAALKAFGISENNPRANNRRKFCNSSEFRAKIRDAGLIQQNDGGKGIPQGSPMSAVLSNLYLLDFDRCINERVAAVGGFYRRYCDDMLCVVPFANAREIETLIITEIAKVELEIQVAKTTRNHFRRSGTKIAVDKPLQYLGFVFDGERVLLRNAGITRFYSRLRAGVGLAAATKAKGDLQRTVAEAAADRIRRKKLNIRYSYLGNRNFVSYAVRASNQFDDLAIKKQVRRHWRKLNSAVMKAEHKLNKDRVP